jgi:hypothetical protein
MHNHIEVTDYRPAAQGSRIGFVDLVIKPLGLWINGCILHRHPASGATWVQVPAAVREDAAGKAVIGPDGRPAFRSIAGFPDKADRQRVTDEVVRQITAKWGAP